MPLIEAENLEKIYGEGSAATVALNDVSFSINSGEFAAVMGPSGSGKSTLLHVLGFLDRPSAGTYRFDGRTMEDFSPEELARVRNKEMGFVFQAFHLLPRATVLENVKLPLLYSDIPEHEWEDRARAALEAVGLSERLGHQPSQLSGGEKQRVAIARALVNDPQVIFADEPTGNLDSKSGEMVMDTIRGLSEKGKTVILITHETYTAEYAERIITMKDGAIESDRRVPSASRRNHFVK